MLQASVDSEIAAEQQQAAMPEKRISEVNMVAVQTAEGLTAKTLSIPQSGEAILYFGATWCGPCKAIAPELNRFVERVGAAGTDTKVFRFSIDEDSDRFAEAISTRYPDGVISQADYHQFGLRGVPSYVRFKDGIVQESGILTPRVMQSWHDALGN